MASCRFIWTGELVDTEQVDCGHDFDRLYPGLLALVKSVFTGGWNGGF